MSPNVLRILGMVFLIAAAVMAVLNLKRVADLGVVWLSPVLMVIGLALLAASRRRGTSAADGKPKMY